MRIGTQMFGVFILGLVLAGPVVAQDTQTMQRDLPDICQAAGTKTASAQSMDGMSGMHHMDKAQQAFMTAMMRMHPAMQEAIMAAEDTDVAFVCGMIPHHRGAIAMARIELKHGDSEWAKEMARKIIKAQKKEIAAMKNWLEERAG